MQKKAVANILRGEVFNMTYVIFEPPGTGKTALLVETILQIFKLVPGVRLLVCTPSNSSAGLITTRLIESDVLEMGELIHLVSHKELKKELIPEHLMPFCLAGDKYWYTGLNCYCEDEMIVTKSGFKLKCQMKYLGRHRVTIGICATLGNFLQMCFPPNHFTHVLIDEAGHIKRAWPGNPCWRSLSIASSHYKRICRALPSIVNAYNELLIPMIREENSREAQMLKQLDDLLPQSPNRPKAFGIFFHGICSEKDSPSWYNPYETKKLNCIVRTLNRNPSALTSYIKQAEYLRKLFVDANVAMPKIGTVVEFQGQIQPSSDEERIPNDMRHALGFIQNEKLTNLAISCL
ncbi:hypothetical protein GQX74_011079 [Glossina fuscipes]|nr:hypothetical protein GQX74_011079 [Glossina fuscipes]